MVILQECNIEGLKRHKMNEWMIFFFLRIQILEYRVWRIVKIKLLFATNKA